MVGAERSVIAEIAEHDFGIASATVAPSFIMTFGVAKALANLLLGVNQGLAWSVVIAMKMDLVRADQRGAAMGINEFTGYVSIAVTALFAGWLAARYGSRPAPFLLPAALSIAGLAASVLLIRETHGHMRREVALRDTDNGHILRHADVFRLASWRHSSLRAAQAGLVTKMNDALVWGLVPLLLATAGLRPSKIAIVAAVYPATWGVAQLGKGALSDHLGRKRLIVLGMAIQSLAVSLLLVSGGFVEWALAAAALGLGAALVYPTLLAVVGDVADPQWRASAVGVYRL